ncbi:hypothetical protein V8V91_22800 [Algoriphagus halophilus]|uniref:hypothetical protein n=1 Tax=Algoriphagus halophilus TaxID=226505 RepID=UPI00358FACE3
MVKKIVIMGLLIGVAFILHSCSNMHMTGGVGMSFSGGPYGVRMTPSINVGMYGGGPRW